MDNHSGYYDTSSIAAETQSVLDSELYDYDVESFAMNEVYAEQLREFLPVKRCVHPLLVLALLFVCFPVGLIVMYAFTRWGTFPKVLITVFVLSVVVAIYEILVAKQVLLLPGLFEMLTELFTA